MTRALSLLDPANIPTHADATAILLKAVRGWRRARDNGDAVQPRLFAQLSRRSYGMLAPVLDSLIALYEAALGRTLAVNRASAPSEDERMLLDLMHGVRSRAGCLRCDEGLGSALDCAICSTRIMMAMTMSAMPETL